MKDGPPPPHDRSGRRVVARVGEWEVRTFAEGSRMHAYFAPRGLLHLQLWHPARGVSVLTPSRLTAHHWEVFPVAGWKLPVSDEHLLREVIARRLGLELPSPATLEALQRWFLDRAIREALRAQERQAHAPPTRGYLPRGGG